MKRKPLHLQLLVAVIIICSNFTGCCLFTVSDKPQDDYLEINLPQWPPSENTDRSWPELSRWKITIVKAEEEYTFYTAKSDSLSKTPTPSIIIRIERNKPCSILAQPLTLLPADSASPQKECAFFKPAGFIYPWYADKSTASWEQGFLADIMAKFFRDGKGGCIPSEDTEYIVSTFNWIKAQEVIEKKISESSDVTSDKCFYNPWLIEYNVILQNLSSSQFKQSLLNNTGCSSIPLSLIKEKRPDITSLTQNLIFSSFVIENSVIREKQQLTLRKNTPELFSLGQNLGILIDYKSLKNISLEFIYLPIYIEDI